MGVLDFFKKKRKEKLIICFSKDKTEEELLKNFFEAYADKIKSVTNETDKEIKYKFVATVDGVETNKYLEKIQDAFVEEAKISNYSLENIFWKQSF